MHHGAYFIEDIMAEKKEYNEKIGSNWRNVVT